MTPFPPEVQQLLEDASKSVRVASASRFQCRIFGDEWDNFIEQWASRAYVFLLHALGPFQKEPLPEILGISDGAHSAGVNASFTPMTGQIRLSASTLRGQPGTILEKITHELVHASLADFPEGDPFYEEGFVDFSVWVMSHAPAWEPYRKQMIEAAAFNIECRRDRALRDTSDYDRKRWAGGLFCSAMHGPWIVARLRARKTEGNLTW